MILSLRNYLQSSETSAITKSYLEAFRIICDQQHLRHRNVLYCASCG